MHSRNDNIKAVPMPGLFVFVLLALLATTARSLKEELFEQYEQLSTVYREQGMYHIAQKYLHAAVDLRKGSIHPEDSDQCSSFADLARLQLALHEVNLKLGNLLDSFLAVLEASILDKQIGTKPLLQFTHQRILSSASLQQELREILKPDKASLFLDRYGAQEGRQIDLLALFSECSDGNTLGEVRGEQVVSLLALFTFEDESDVCESVERGESDSSVDIDVPISTYTLFPTFINHANIKKGPEDGDGLSRESWRRLEGLGWLGWLLIRELDGEEAFTTRNNAVW